MVPSKRKHDETTDSDSDSPTFGKQILPVADLPDDFDAEPSDGLQYLFTVRRDAKTLPQFTRVENPYEGSSQPSSSSPWKECKRPHPSLPSLEWRELSERRWRNYHKNFNQGTIGTSLPVSEGKTMPDKGERDLWWEFIAGKPESIWAQPKLSKSKKANQQHSTFSRGRMRAWNNQAAGEYAHDEGENESVHETVVTSQPIALGEYEASNTANDEGEVENALKLHPQDSLPTPTGTPAPPDGIGLCVPQPPPIPLNPAHAEGRFMPREPTSQLLKSIDERTALRLLMYFTFWIHRHLREPDLQAYQLTETHARWMFSLILRIDDYVSADDMNLLRNLARACLSFAKGTILKRTTGVSSKPDTSIETAPQARRMREQACWVIISGIVGIWSQRDLWVDVEDTLAGLA